MRNDKYAKIVEIVNRKRCGLWPECGCASQLEFWQKKFRHDPIGWDLEQLRRADLSIYLMLECIAAHCPNRKIRAKAEIELLNPFWDRQRRGEELTEEYVAKRVAEAKRRCS
jgi:hypothetical protein